MRPRIAIPQPHSEKPDYNRRALPQYLEAVEQAGGQAVEIDLHLSPAEIARLASTCDAVLLPGSPADLDPEKYGEPQRHEKTAAADPLRDNADELLLQDAYNLHKPLLGICYGLQALNVWRSGTLLQHVENHSQGRAVERAHRVTVVPETRLAGIVEPAWEDSPGAREWVNSSHHQVAGQVGDGLRVSARSEDGLVEAIESTSPEHFVLAVQWHPERTTESDPASRAIFRALVEAARKRHAELQASMEAQER